MPISELFHNVFDRLDFVIGEHVWCFADFATKQGIIRIGGNKKVYLHVSDNQNPQLFYYAIAGYNQNR